jgi:hypothetical protein
VSSKKSARYGGFFCNISGFVHLIRLVETNYSKKGSLGVSSLPFQTPIGGPLGGILMWLVSNGHNVEARLHIGSCLLSSRSSPTHP